MDESFEELTWSELDRFAGIRRDYGFAEVKRLRGSVHVEHTLARLGAERLWRLLNETPYVNALGAVTGTQAMQKVRAGLKSIYLSGWQVAADSNVAGAMYPDQSLYPANSGPELARRINNALQRADQISHLEGDASIEWLVPILADAEAGFGGPLNAFELTKAYIMAGAAGVHFEDQLASEKKCGHMGGKVLIPTAAHIRNLNAARLAADVMGVPTLILCRTDAESAKLITSDVDERDRPFIHAEYPGKLLAYYCSPSFNWAANLDVDAIASFQSDIAAMGYKYQFVTLAGFHQLNHGMFELAQGYAARGMAAYSELQQAEFAAVERGYSAVRHQREVGTGYFDAVSEAITGGSS